MTRAAIYVRVSTARQAERDLSIPDQIVQCRTWCQRQDIEVVQVFSEPVGRNPDSLLWVMAALWLPLPVPSGCSAAFWDRSPGLWNATGTLPGQKVSDLFTETKRYGPVATVTARAALRFQHGAGLLGAAKALKRHLAKSSVGASSAPRSAE